MAEELPALIITRPEASGDIHMFLNHRPGAIDCKWARVVKEGVPAEGEPQLYRYFDSYDDPETTGYYKSVDGLDEVHIFALAPKKYCWKFVLDKATGIYKCTNGSGETAVKAPAGCAPLPSLLGAGGLPKGQINLGGADDEEWSLPF